MTTIGVLIPLTLGRSAPERLYGEAASAPAAAVGFAGYLALSAVLNVAFTRGGYSVRALGDAAVHRVGGRLFM